MSFVDNLRNSLSSMFGLETVSSEPKVVKKEAPKMNRRIDVLNMPEPPPKKMGDYLGAMRGWVYRAVDSISQEVASVDLVLYRKKGDEVVEVKEHPALDTLYRANDFQTKFDFFGGTQAYLELTGEAFWFKDKGKKGNGKPKELWQLRPDWVKIGKEDGERVYEYTVPSSNKTVVYKKDQIVHFKYFNPTNHYRGLGPLQAAAYAYDTDFYATKWNRNFFYNNAMPNTVLIAPPEAKLKDEDIKRMRTEWENKFGGVSNAHKIAILTGGVKIDDVLQQTTRDMEFLELRKFTRDEIFTIFQVPKTIVAITEDVNRAAAKEHRAVWLENVIKPKMEKMVAFLNEFYINDFGDDLWFGFEDPTPDNVETNLKIATDGAEFLTINERREIMGYPPIEEGDYIYMPFNISPALEGEQTEKMMSELKVKADEKKDYKPERKIIGKEYRTTLDMAKTTVKEHFKEAGMDEEIRELAGLIASGKAEEAEIKEDDEEDKEEKYKYLEREKAVEFWKQFVARSEVQEKGLHEILRTFFDKQEEKVLEKVSNIKMLGRIKNVDRYLFDVDKESDILVEMVYPLFRELVEQSGKSALELLGIEDDITWNEQIEQVLRDYGTKMATVVNKTTYDKLDEIIRDGISEDESVDEIAKRITDEYKNISEVRGKRISRTETIRASNLGNLEGYKQSGVVVKKEWLVALDERTCQFCLKMEEEYQTRELDLPFLEEGTELKGVDGGTLAIDYSDLLAPPLHPNCRCVIVPVVSGE